MATNRLDKVYLSEANLETIANGGSIQSGDDSYSADENTLYLVPDDSISQYLHKVHFEGDANSEGYIGDILILSSVGTAYSNLQSANGSTIISGRLINDKDGYGFNICNASISSNSLQCTLMIDNALPVDLTFNSQEMYTWTDSTVIEL